MLKEYTKFSSLHIETKGTAKDLLQSFELRHRTYCLEKNFIDDKDDTLLESDEYDEDDKISEHFIVRTEEIPDESIGCARLVRHTTEKGFPTEHRFPILHDVLLKKFGAVHLDEINEFSRLCIDARYRRRQEPLDQFYGIDSYISDQPDVRRKYPIILFLLFREMYRFSRDNGVKYWIASIEENLLRFLNMYGFTCEPLLDGFIDFHGQVKPVLLTLETILEGLRTTKPEVYKFMCVPE